MALAQCLWSWNDTLMYVCETLLISGPPDWTSAECWDGSHHNDVFIAIDLDVKKSRISATVVRQ